MFAVFGSASHHYMLHWVGRFYAETINHFEETRVEWKELIIYAFGKRGPEAGQG